MRRHAKAPIAGSHTSPRLLAVLVFSAFALLAVLASTATATVVRPYESQLTEANGSSFTEPRGVAVDPADNLWVSDTGSSLVSKFDSTGAYLAQNDGTGSWGASQYIQGLAYGATANLLYVADSNFDDLWGLNPDATYSGTRLNAGLGGCCFIRAAVDNSGAADDGDIYVASGTGASVIRVDAADAASDFSASQPYVSGNTLTGTPDHPFGSLAAIAVDSSGDIYVADGDNLEVDQFDSSGTFVRAFTGSFGSISALAIDPTNGHLLIGDSGQGVIHEFGPAGAFLSSTSGAATPAGSFSPQGIAVDSSGKVYVSDPAHAVVDVLGAPVTVPTTTTGSAMATSATSATLDGSVDPEGIAVTDCHFSYTDDADFQANGWANATDAGCVPSSPSGSGQVAVSAQISGLAQETTYHFRLLVTNVNGTTSGEDVTFITPGPPIVTTYAVHGYPTDTTAHVAGSVNPNNAPTAYWFEYATEADFSDAQSVPASEDADAGSGSEAQLFGQDLAGLEPNTTYHYRIVADNGVGGPVIGSDETVTTTATPPPAQPCPNETIRQRQSAQMLGSCRAWELVGPFGKEQSNIVFGDIAAAGDRAVLGGTAAADGGGFQTPTLSVREPSGWEYRPLLSAGERLFPNYLFALYNAELTRFIAQASNSLLGGTGPTATIALEEGGLETVLSVLHNPGSSAIQQAGNDELTHVFGPIRTGPERINHLFEISQDPPVQADILPDGSTPACGIDRNGSWAQSENLIRWVSSDGSRVFFISYVHDDENGEPCGFPLGPKRLYMRDLDLDETTLISTPPLSGPDVSDLEFLGARADGEAALFATASRFDPDDDDESADVYRWSEGAGNACLTCVAPAAAAIDEAPIYASNVAASSDFSHVYFTSSAALAPGAVPGERNLYVWRVTSASGPEGEVDFVAPGERFFANQVSANGRFLAFQASSPGLDQLSGGSGNGYRQLYRYDDVSRSVVCVSCPSGHAATADLYPHLALRLGAVANRSSTRIMSDDGSQLAFPASEALVAADVNDSVDVYAWHEGRLSLVSDGRTEFFPRPQHEVIFLGISGNGDDVLFLSEAALTPGTEADASHAYVARVKGGFTSPASPSPCGGEGCQAAPTGPPASPAAATADFVGPANLKPPRRCQRGKKHCRGKKRQHAKNHKRGHRAGADRRASR